MQEPLPNAAPNPDAIAEQNTARLLAESYRPELPDPAFAESVKDAMLAARTPAFRLWPQTRERSWLPAVAAILVIIAGILLVITSLRDPGPTPRQPIVHNNNTDHTRPPATMGEVAGASGQNLPGAAAPTPVLAGNRLTARPAASRPALDRVEIGQTITTAAGQRRRVGLSDGSVLFINQNTSLHIDGPRRVTLNSGEAYFEVSPRQGVPSVKDPTFLVKTPGRSVAALGTHFAVEVGNNGTGVVVAQGKVNVDGVDVNCGEELAPEKENPNATVIKTPRLSVILDWIRDLVAAAQTPLVPASNYDGGALIAIDPWGQEARLTLRSYNVDVYIEDGFARTTIDQTYFNANNWRMEGTFYFPLPADASLSRLAMYVDGTLMEGGMCEREQAREVYETIVTTRRDPALLEWVDGTTFKMRVFPLEARQEKRILLSYTQKLDSLYGQTQYRFPAGHTKSFVRDWSFKATVKNAASAVWGSGSHTLASTTQNGDLLLSASDHVAQLDKDVTLSLGDLSPAAAGRTRFAAATYEGQRYLMVRAQPPLATATQRQRRDWIFLFESSGARDPLLARAQIEIVRTLLENAEHEDTFAIVTAGSHVNAMGDPLPATAENIARAVAYLEQTHLVGALDLGQALDATVPYVTNAANPYLVHLGTGISILGARAADELVKRIPVPAKYVGIGVGKSWSRQFMKAAAAKTGGYFTQINPDEPVAWRAFDLLATLNTPRLLDVKVIEPTEKISFLSFEDALAQGEELCAIARFPANTPAPAELTLTGTLDGRPYVQTLRVADILDNAGYLPRMWAKLEIDRLLAADSQANKSAIVALSKDMYVMSPFTSLLVLENEAMYQQYHVDRGRKDHWAMYPAPDKIPVVTEPDPLTTATPVVGQKLTVDQALTSIIVRMPAQLVYWPNQPRYYGPYTTALSLLNGSYQPDMRYLDWQDSPGVIDVSGQLFNQQKRQRGWLDRDNFRLGDREWGQLMLGQSINGRFWDDEIMLRGLKTDYSFGLTKRGSGYLTLNGINTYSGSTFISNGKIIISGGGILNLNGGMLSSSRLMVAGDDSRFWRSGQTLSSLMLADDAQRLSFLTSNGTLLLPRFDSDTKQRASDRWYSTYTYDRAAYVFSNSYSSLQYQRPSYNNDWRAFSDLLQYAPGMNTSLADIQSILDAEATADPASAPGTIDPQARALINRARAAGWQAVSLSQGPRLPAFVVTFDGGGRYRYERTLSEDLHETVVCDGTTLLQLYPDLGVGARRTISRFHRQSLSDLIPWALPAADDLAHGSTLTLAADRTVQIAPTGADTRKDADGKPVAYVAQRLVFAADGRLAERRWIEMPTGKTLGRQTYSAAGVVRTFDDQDKELATQDLALKPASSPAIITDTKDLVVLPMPIRSRDDALRGQKLNSAYNSDEIAKWPEEKVLGLIASDLCGAPDEAATLIASRYFSQGDRRIGFYILLLASHYSPNSVPIVLNNNTTVKFQPLVDHPDSALARYFANQWKIQQQGNNADIGAAPAPRGFIDRLAAVRHALYRFQRGGSVPADATTALQLARSCNDPRFAWALVTAAMSYGGGNREMYTAIAETAKSLQNAPGLAYVARYEEARALYQTGAQENREPAKSKFLDLYRDTLAAGSLPLIDHDFRNAVQAGNAEVWPMLMCQTAATLLSKYGRPSMFYLAWQCNQLGDQALAEEFVAFALSDIPDDQRTSTIVVAVRYLQSVSQFPSAAKVLQPLLDDPKWNDSPELWWLAAQLSYSGGMLAQGLTYQEKAMDLEFAKLPPLINLQALRSEYGQAMNQYLTLANAIATLQQTPPNDLVTRVIRTADRWRALDPDKTAPCQAAARVFQALNVRELAWDYLTTPLADKSNEAQPWANLAQALRQQSDYTLADRAYATAFDLEPTNAQVLFDRANLLVQMNNLSEARKVYQRLADGKWEPRFSNLQTQAKSYLQNH